VRLCGADPSRAGLTLVVVALLACEGSGTPSNYEDCVLQAIRDRNRSKAELGLIHSVCQQKYPRPTRPPENPPFIPIGEVAPPSSPSRAAARSSSEDPFEAFAPNRENGENSGKDSSSRGLFADIAPVRTQETGEAWEDWRIQVASEDRDRLTGTAGRSWTPGYFTVRIYNPSRWTITEVEVKVWPEHDEDLAKLYKVSLVNSEIGPKEANEFSFQVVDDAPAADLCWSLESVDGRHPLGGWARIPLFDEPDSGAADTAGSH
jgi:hypothetical protein